MRTFIIQILMNAVAVFGASYLLRGIHVRDFKYAIIVALVLSLLNTFIKPAMVFFSFPITILTLGLFLLVVNAAIIKIAAWLIGDGFRVDGWWWAIAFSIVITILNSILEWILG
ncbi:MAG: phage holin family protein [Chitinophagales bacterium]|nr:phage holin family protein [Chitinophagales bacterium]MCO5280400.1 phage holin family protein [Chitinophagales bacterium]OJV25600.1 MAG: hypothetical protein BGO32_00890 [Bacteroidetes bacterium 37-13]HRN95187.1 phage holin family protein [Chitinophagales bacterium]HRP38193.1 phage holin family protein [Chitinophagales bacterium]